MMDVTTFFRDNIRRLTPYSTARDEYTGSIGIYLDANESPYDNGTNRYPDPRQRALKQELARIKGVAPEQIFAGNGSDEAIDLMFRIFCTPGVHNAVSIAPTYGMYQVAADINNVEMRQVQLNPDFGLDADRLLAATDADTRLVFICSPNNPTGNCFSPEAVLSVAQRFNGIVVVDEAYIDFADNPGFVAVLPQYPNLVILQTMSKAWGMAALRLGLAIADARIIEVMNRVKYPYNINAVTQAMALERIKDAAGPEVAEIKEQRQLLARELAQCPCVQKVYPSDANFLLVRVDNARALYTLLTDNGIIVRDRSRVQGCEGCLRITVGTPEQNQRVIQILKGV